MLRFLTAGESHGQTLVMTLDGMPAGLEIDIDAVNAQLRRRQGGYGRGRRMRIESDRAEIMAGMRHGRTTGAPIALLIRNRDWVNWQQTMYVEREMPEGATGSNRPDVTRPRPGHADLAGAIKYGHTDVRDVLERASARETAARVAHRLVGRRAQVEDRQTSMTQPGRRVDDDALCVRPPVRQRPGHPFQYSAIRRSAGASDQARNAAHDAMSPPVRGRSCLPRESGRRRRIAVSGARAPMPAYSQRNG